MIKQGVVHLVLLITPHVRRIGKAVASLFMAFLISGCATVFRPYVDAKISDQDEEHFQQLSASINEVEKLRGTVQSRRDEVVLIRTALGLTSAAGVMGATIAGLYGAHKDTIVAFGLGAGAAYTGGSLYASASKSALYEAANQALFCVATTGMQTINTWQGIERDMPSHEDSRDAGQALAKKYADITDTEDKKLVAALNEAITKFEGERRRFEAFGAMDPEAARQIQQAAGAVTEALNTKLAEAEPNLDAILAAVGGIGRMAGSYVPAPQLKVAAERTISRKKGAYEPPPPPKIDDEDRPTIVSLTANLSDASEAIASQIKAAVNRLDEVGKKCLLKAPEIAPLVASPTEATLSKDSNLKVTLTGGNLPLSADWTGENKPTADAIDFVLSGRDLILIGKSGIEGVETYQIRVSDARAAPAHTDIVVKTK